jgi:two-component system invasion response regulator UvrY
MKTILIADDHEIIRMGVRMLIESFPEKYNFIEAATCVEIMQAFTDEQVHYAVLDVFLADGDLFSEIREISKHCQQTNILVYSMVPEKIYAKRFLKRGISGYVSKHATMKELENAILCCLQGQIYLSKAMREDLMRPKQEGISGNPFDLLSDAELQVVKYVAMGIDTKEIALKMKLKIATVNTYQRLAFKKLNVTDRVELEKRFLY